MKTVCNVFFTVLVVLFYFSGNAQEMNYKSIHQIESEYYKELGYKTKNDFDLLNKFEKTNFKLNPDCELDYIVFGWHPYWMGSAYENYQWHLLSDISYFSYEVDPANGEALDTHGWETTSVVDSAQANGTRINLCVTLFSGHSTFFGNAASQQTLITNLINLVQLRNADGVNIDFEGVPSSQAEAFNLFLLELAEQLHTAIPGSQLSLALYAVDWNNIFDEELLKDHVDLFVIMAYDYYWQGASVAGPTGQLYKMYDFNYTLGRSSAYYLNEGIPKEKLVCAVPYYGWEWKTLSDDVPTVTENNAVSKTIRTLKDNSNGYYSEKQTDPNSLCEYYNYFTGGSWNQLWIDDEVGMRYKYDLIKQIGLAGIGMWALGYDNAYSEMWQLIENEFTNCEESPWRYEFYDLGGPTRDHFNNESYEFTIQPESYEDYLAVNFHEFELEAGWDSLWIYDGPNSDSQLIGGYSGSSSPGLIEASGDALTFKFYSDGATVKLGWVAEWRVNPLDIGYDKARKTFVIPNPADEIIHIKADQFIYAEIFTIDGKLILSTQKKQLDIGFLASGKYLIRIITKKGHSVKKIIKN